MVTFFYFRTFLLYLSTFNFIIKLLLSGSVVEVEAAVVDVVDVVVIAVVVELLNKDHLSTTARIFEATT